VRSRFLIVDDHAGFRATARRLLSAAGYEVVGEASDAAGALDAVARLDPDLVLLDLALPDLDGVELARRLAQLRADLRIVLVSSRDREEVEPLLAGAPLRGFVPKDELSAGAIGALLG